MECETGNGDITCNGAKILQKLESDFSNLYKHVDTTSDDAFHVHAMQHKQYLYSNMLEHLFKPNEKIKWNDFHRRIEKGCF